VIEEDFCERLCQKGKELKPLKKGNMVLNKQRGEELNVVVLCLGRGLKVTSLRENPRRKSRRANRTRDLEHEEPEKKI
jgi:hypothetical protein